MYCFTSRIAGKSELVGSNKFINVMYEYHYKVMNTTIIESVDSISRDGPDMPYNYVIHYKYPNAVFSRIRRISLISAYSLLSACNFPDLSTRC